jgi:hydrogenase/urease accessory protein HupE
MRRWRNAVACLLGRLGVLWIVAAAHAHDPGLSSADLRVFPDRLEAHLTFARGDVETLLPLDTDSDGAVSTNELAAVQMKLAALAAEMLSVRGDSNSVPSQQPRSELDTTNNVHFRATYPLRAPKLLVIHSALIDRMPRGHRQFTTLYEGDGTALAEMLLSAEQDVVEADLGELFPQSHTFTDFLKLGVEHIVTGYDHLLFLFGLLIVVPRLRTAALIITCFTVAHTVTLGLATLGVVQMRSDIVEPLIAATIVYVGVENLLKPEGPRWRWLLTLAFGLIHGFGFAGVLVELGVSSSRGGVALPLFSFNLGVELGQIAIAAVVLPVLWWLRRFGWFKRFAVPGASVFLILIGAWWLLERTVLAK